MSGDVRGAGVLPDLRQAGADSAAGAQAGGEPGAVVEAGGSSLAGRLTLRQQEAALDVIRCAKAYLARGDGINRAALLSAMRWWELTDG